MKFILHSKYKKLESIICQIIKDFYASGELVFKGTRNTVKSFLLENEKISIKFFQKPGWIKSFIYSFLRESKAKRSFDYANYLIDHNISTPFPIAYFENKNKFGFLKDSYYVCQQIDYDFTIRELIHNPLFPERDIILQQFTEFTFKIHQANIKFLDHSPGNTLVIKKSFENYDFYLIDLNRMKFKELSIEERMDNFKKMWMSKTMLKTVAQTYAKLSNQPKEKLYNIVLEKTKKFKIRSTKKKYFKKLIKSYF